MTKSKIKREAFFWRGAAALANLDPRLKEAYVCPLCRKIWPHDSLEAKELTLEHAPPKCLGGKAVALTCRSCNVQAGSSVDRERRNLEDLREFNRGEMGRVMYARQTIPGSDRPVNVQLRRDGDNNTISFLEKCNPPNRLAEWNSALANAKKKGTLVNDNFQLLPGVDLDRARVSDLKTAYMVAFAGFGYKYILRSTLDQVRNQILEPGSRLLTNFHFDRRDADPHERHLIITKQPVSSIYVQVGRSVIFFPTPMDDETFYSDLPERVASGENFSGEEYTWPSRMEMMLDFVKEDPGRP